jgi:hypothetical protein
MPVYVFCETSELMVEARAAAESLGLEMTLELSASPLAAAAQSLTAHALAVALVLYPPQIDDFLKALPELRPGSRLVMGWLGPSDGARRAVFRDLGVVCVDDVGPALSAAAWLQAGAGPDVKLSTRYVAEVDRARLGPWSSSGEKSGYRLLSLGAGQLALGRTDGGSQRQLGHATWVREAARAIRACERTPEPPFPFQTPVDLATSRDVLFGPPRKLSDPASKAALAPFGLPLPQEELCSSPSRAASEAARLGFPVRIALASPDLRVWDHPELSVDGVDNAARVRDVYRQLMARAGDMSSEARVLGVSVSATTLARALLSLSAHPVRGGRVTIRIGFADPHGIVTRDATATVLPASRSSVERALDRLRGNALLFGDEPGERQQARDLIAELLTQLGSFVDAFRNEVERVDLNPVAILVGGGAEVREAAVHVTDAFVRELG